MEPTEAQRQAERFRRDVARCIEYRHCMIRRDQDSPTRQGRQSPGLLSKFEPPRELLDDVSELSDGVKFIDFGEPKNALKERLKLHYINTAAMKPTRRPSRIPVSNAFIAELEEHSRQMESKATAESKTRHVRAQSLGNALLGAGGPRVDFAAGDSYSNMRETRVRSSFHTKFDN
jgi:hypothetical protein